MFLRKDERPPEPCAWVRIPPRALLDVGVEFVLVGEPIVIG
jgi:hypothetical protein